MLLSLWLDVDYPNLQQEHRGPHLFRPPVGGRKRCPTNSNPICAKQRTQLPASVHTVTINGTLLTSGIYFLRASRNDGVMLRRKVVNVKRSARLLGEK